MNWGNRPPGFIICFYLLGSHQQSFLLHDCNLGKCFFICGTRVVIFVCVVLECECWGRTSFKCSCFLQDTDAVMWKWLMLRTQRSLPWKPCVPNSLAENLCISSPWLKLCMRKILISVSCGLKIASSTCKFVPNVNLFCSLNHLILHKFKLLDQRLFAGNLSFDIDEQNVIYVSFDIFSKVLSNTIILDCRKNFFQECRKDRTSKICFRCWCWF